MTKSTRLKRAREMRRRRALAYVALQNNQITIVSVLEDTPRILRDVPIYELLRHAHKMGRTGSEKCLKKAKVWPLTRAGYLSEEERERIIAHLPPRALED